MGGSLLLRWCPRLGWWGVLLAGVTAAGGRRRDGARGAGYEAVGGFEAMRRIVARFYAGVAEDPVLRPLYPEEDLGPAEERFLLFLVQFWGGRRRSRTTAAPRGCGCGTRRSPSPSRPRSTGSSTSGQV